MEDKKVLKEGKNILSSWKTDKTVSYFQRKK